MPGNSHLATVNNAEALCLSSFAPSGIEEKMAGTTLFAGLLQRRSAQMLVMEIESSFLPAPS
jgi:hypothetical protein